MINIIILNWNSFIDLYELVTFSLKNQTIRCYRLIVVDNFSAVEERSRLVNLCNTLRSEMEIHLVLNDRNLGYAAGNNVGYEYCENNLLDGDVLVLNPDVRLLPDTLEKITEAMIEEVGSVMCRTRNEENVILYDALKLKGFRQWNVTLPDYEIHETDYCAGSCLLIKRNLINEVGLFDDKFFMYWEEVDLSYRIKKFGYRVVTTTHTSIYRKSNHPFRNINAVYFYIRNSFFLHIKHPEEFTLTSLIKFLTISFLSQVALMFRKKEPKRIYKYFNGLLAGLAACYADKGI